MKNAEFIYSPLRYRYWVTPTVGNPVCLCHLEQCRGAGS